MESKKASELNQVGKRLKVERNVKPKKAVITGMHNELRAQILILLNERVASRPEICKELGASFDGVRYEMEVLKKTSPPLIEFVNQKRVRGTVEKFYRATTQAYLDPTEWPGVPDAVKVGMRGSLLSTLVDDAVAAVECGTFDALENAHMSWTPMILDVQGWEELTAILLRAMEEAVKVKEESAARLAAQDADGISCAVSILGYPTANENRKVGPPRDEMKGGAKKKAVGKAKKAPRDRGSKESRAQRRNQSRKDSRKQP